MWLVRTLLEGYIGAVAYATTESMIAASIIVVIAHNVFPTFDRLLWRSHRFDDFLEESSDEEED